MSALVLSLLLLSSPQSSRAGLLGGVWFDTNDVPVLIDGGHIEWEVESRYVSADVGPVEDGSYLGSYASGRSLLGTITSGYSPLGMSSVYPDSKTFASPFGEARLKVATLDRSGHPVVADLGTAPNGSRSPVVWRIVRAAPTSILSVEGSYGDKDLQIEIQDESGTRGKLAGTLTYLGTKRRIEGDRVLGRGVFSLIDTSRSTTVGYGNVVWSPGEDRASKILNHDSTKTDRIAVYFRLNDGPAAGIHKILKRAP